MLRYVFILAALFFACFSRADFDEALALYQKKDFTAAFVEFKRLSELGDHDAQFNFGVMYYRGESVERDSVAAYAWMSLAVEGKGAVDAGKKATLEKIYSNFDMAQRSEADKKREELLAAYGEAALAVKLAPVLADTNGDNQVRIIKKVSPIYPRAMLVNGIVGSVDLIYGVGADGTVRDIGVLNFTEKGFIDSTVEALKAWRFEPVLVNGRPTAVYGQATRFIFVLNGAEFDNSKILQAAAAARKKAEGGASSDQYNYAYFLEIVPTYTHVKLEPDANQWYFSSAVSGNARAQFSLGKNLLYGNACSPDSAKSFFWLEKAANQGVPDAQYLLAIEMLSGIRLAKNESAAITLLQKAADAKYSNAQLKLAWIYATNADNALRNGSLAKSYVDKVSDGVFDKRTLYEVMAAVAAELGNFDEAVKWQNAARLDMKSHELPLASVDEKLEAYKAHRAWVEAL